MNPAHAQTKREKRIERLTARATELQAEFDTLEKESVPRYHRIDEVKVELRKVRKAIKHHEDRLREHRKHERNGWVKGLGNAVAA